MKKLVVTVFAVIGLISCSQEKTAYIDLPTLLEDYQGRKDIETKYKDKMEKFGMRRDSIGKSLDAEGQDFQTKANSMSQSKQQEEYQKLMQKAQRLQQVLQQEEYKISQEGQVEIDTLISEVKDFVKVYGADNNYTYIFGANESGSVMYGADDKNITEDVLKALNDKYARE
ncbi:outer membrane protein [Pustulibacterium marinum]|uniref:Outer membrane protein n=1 Tax=Pustulibacterium marinum TaxID=1224947 RepID=A0A1I7ETK8_9FLAO|nr:OmpH family outer membrane protein [Pustulibacterium marinum]SFU27212.1 outer membrane protein [Pustulibacterium marinum]